MNIILYCAVFILFKYKTVNFCFLVLFLPAPPQQVTQ